MPPSSRRPTELVENPVELVPVIETDVNLTKIERKLKKFFKCCFFRGQKCFFTTNEPLNFLLHMQIKHQNSSSMFCFYCHNDGKDTLFDDPSHLIDHMLIEHAFRRYQCNLCYYRAPSKIHVLLHQANTHGDKFRATMKGTSTDMCKVLVCPQLVAAANPGPITYWRHFRKNHTNDQLDDDNDLGKTYRCLYCNFRSSSDHSVFAHIGKDHCDYPLVIHDKWHDPILLTTETDETDDADQNHTEQLLTEDPDDEELDSIVNRIYNPDDNGDIGDDNGDDYGPRDELPPSPEPIQDMDEPSTSDNNTAPSHEISKDKQTTHYIKQKGQIAKKRTTPLVRPLPEPPKESSEEESEDEYVTRPTRKPRGYIPESVNVHELTPLTPLTVTKPSSMRNLFQCIICNDKAPIRQTGISIHIRQVHKAQGSLKCSECNFIGSKLEILQHGRENHPCISTTVVKFIIGLDDDSSGTIMGTGKSTSKPLLASKKPSTNLSSKPGPKSFHEKNLSTKIKASTFVGPKNWSKEKPTSSEKASSSESDPDSDSESALIASQRREKKFTDNTIVERMNNRERGCSRYFCLFCDKIPESYDMAFACMRKHLGIYMNCPDCSFRAGSAEELRIHHKSAHPGILLKRQKDPPGTFDKDNYIVEFLNDQFRFCRKASEMSAEQLSKEVYIVCPICEKANKLIGGENFRFTQWRSFKVHFWKHSGTSRIFCTACSCYVARTRKHMHILEKHAKNEEEDDEDEDEEPENPYLNYEDRHRSFISLLSDLKRLCKSIFLERLQESYGIDKELRVVLHRFDEVKQESEPEPMDYY